MMNRDIITSIVYFVDHIVPPEESVECIRKK